MASGASTGVTPSSVSVRVLNGTGIEGQAAAVAEALGYIGFPIVEISGLDTIPLTTSQVRFHPDDLVAAERVARHLPVGTELVEDSSLASGAVAIVTGMNLEGIAEQPLAESALPPPRIAPAADQLPRTNTVVQYEEDGGPETTEVVGRTPGEEPEGVDCR